MRLAERVAAMRELPLPALRIIVVPHSVSNLPKDAIAAAMAPYLDAAHSAVFAPPASGLNDAATATDPSRGNPLERLDHADDEEAANELFRARGWLDGLPMLAPTPARVERMLGAHAGERLRILGKVPPKGAPVTLEGLAVNAVMAGCAPAYFPLVVAAARAVLDPAFNLLTTATTTNAASPLLIASGPLARQVGIEGGNDLFGSYHRANISIGRAIRLMLISVGECRPSDGGDMATQGQGMKVGICITEHPDSPWEPLHVELGCRPDETAVIALSTTAQSNLLDFGSRDADELLTMFARSIAVPCMQNMQTPGGPVIVIGIEHARILAAGGLSKADVKQRLFEEARIPIGWFGRDTIKDILKVRRAPWGHASSNPSRLIPIADAVDEITLLVGGGEGQHSVLMPTFHTPRPVLARVESERP